MTERDWLENGLATLLPTVFTQAVDNLLRFSALLREKNKVMNLTAIEDPVEVVKRHFLDSAVLAPLLADGETVLDVGTGAGFPGLPLAILCPQVQFTLLDAQRKRIDFLCEVIAALGLQNVTAVHARAEEFAKAHRETFDAAVSRAVASLPMLSELSLPMVRVGGRFLAMKAADCAAECAQAAHAIEVLGGAPAVLTEYVPPCDTVPRTLVRIDKAQPTPPQYPRRFKKIETQPL